MFWIGSKKRKDHSEDLGVDGRGIIKLMLTKQIGRLRTGLITLSAGTGDCIL
jgi:hypothetical protein